jgi:hypothetical protein
MPPVSSSLAVYVPLLSPFLPSFFFIFLPILLPSSADISQVLTKLNLASAYVGQEKPDGAEYHVEAKVRVRTPHVTVFELESYSSQL